MDLNLLKIHTRSIILSAGLILFLSQFINGQDYSFREYGVRDGLPQSEARIVYQDSRGFIWVATRNGLSRFDGIDFINYYISDGLPTNIVYDAFEDRAGTLMVLAPQGISEYTGSGFRFYAPGPEFSENSFSGSFAISAVRGAIYLVARRYGETKNSILLFEKGKYSDFSSKFTALDTLDVLSMCCDTLNSDLLIIDKRGFLWLWNGKSLSQLRNKAVTDISNDRGKILISEVFNKYEYMDHSVRPKKIDESEGRSEASVFSANGESVVEYFDGVTIHSMNLPLIIWSPFIDKDGTLWLSTENNLLRLLSPAFISWSEKKTGMNIPWAICRDTSGNIWLGSLTGDLLQFDGRKFIDRNDYVKDIRIPEMAYYKGSRLLSNGEMWISTNFGVFIWNGKTFSRLSAIKEYIQVCHIYEDPDDHRIFIGTEKGVFIIDGSKVECLDKFVPDSLGVIEGITKDNSGFYWMSGHKGIVKYDGKNAVPVYDEILPRQYTYLIEKDSHGGIWVSSEEGLYFKPAGEEKFRHGVPAAINKPSNTLKIMDDDHLIVGRLTDICIIDLGMFYKGNQDYFKLYDKTDGYPGAEALDNGIVRGGDGDFWILTNDNLVKFNPSYLKKNLNPPLVHFTGIYYETDSLEWKPVRKGEFYYGVPSEINLDRDQYRVKITYSGISTPNPEKVRYRYMLKEIDNKWSLPDERREVIYRNLDPGSYTFMLKGINSDGIETPDYISINFTIAKAFRETKVFYVSLILLIIVFTILITIHLFKRNQKSKEERQKLKSDLLNLQMNSFLKEFDPHFTFNAISSVGSLIMKNDRKAAYLYLTRLSSLLRASLKDSGSLIKSVAEEVDFVRNYCELQKLRFGDRFNYSINIADDVNLIREVPKMTIQTFVENSLKHGIESRKSGGSIEISLTHVESSLKIVVRDNGVGIKVSRELKSEGTGYGIKTIYRIFEIVNKGNPVKATLDIQDIQDIKNGIYDTGTEVVIVIPDNYSFRINELSFSTSEDEIISRGILSG